MSSEHSRQTNSLSPHRKRPNKIFTLALVILLISLSTSVLPALLRNGFPGVHPVAAAGPNALGVVCGYGASNPAGVFPLPITTKDGDISALNSQCEWAGDIDGDGAFDPLVADNPSLLPGAGGGFIADIVVISLNSAINGFDLTIDYNTTVLNAVLIDQQGLVFGGNFGCASCTLTTASSIDQTLGEIRLAQAILGVTAGPGGTCNVMVNPVCTSPNQELFRIRFDVVGAGRAFINFSTDPTKNVITTPGSLAHTSQNGVLSTDALFSLLNGQTTPASFNESLTFSNPTPGSSITFTAANAICTYCTGTFTYNWDFSSQDSSTYVAKIDATGKSVTITPPPPVIYRVTLTITDGVHTAFATRNLPLKAVGTGPTTAAQGAPVGPFSSKWLGGIVTNTAGYSGQWRFCPGSAISHLVCSSAPVFFSQAPPSITQTSSVPSVSWAFAGFYNNFFSISDTAVAQVSATPNTVIVPVPINITGATPAYTVAVTPDKTSINAGQFVTFTAAITYAGAYPVASKSTAFSYTFNFGDGNITTVTGGGLSVIEPHMFKTGGSFILKVTPRETGSTAPSQIQENGYSPLITVIPPLAADFTFSPTSPTSGQTVTFTSTVTGGNTPYTYAWDFGDGGTSTQANPTHAFTATVSTPFTVKLTVTDSTTPTPQVKTVMKTVTVGPAAFDFGVVWSPASASVTAGGSSTPDVVATLVSGTTTSVACSVSLPSPAVTGLSAAPLTFSLMPSAAGASQAVVVSTTSATPAGAYTISVSCTGGGATHAASPQFSLTVGAPAFDYTVAWSPTSTTIAAGAGTTPSIVAILTSGTATAVTCTVSLPSPAVTGLSASPLSFSVTPAAAPGVTQAIAITTTASTPAGSYTIGVSCTLGVGSHTANFALTVTPAFDYSVAWSPTSASIVAGSSTTPNVVATLTSGTTTAVACTVAIPVAIGLAGSPLSFSITPAVAPGVTQAIAITTTTATPAGTYSISVSCTLGIGTHTANFALTVTPAFDYTVAWSPTSASIVAGSSTTPSVVAILTSGTTTAVSCTVTVPVATGLAASPLTFSITPAVAPGTTQVVTITTSTATPSGSYMISVSCALGIGTHTSDFSLIVGGAFDYSLAWSPTGATILAGGSTTPNVVATLTSGTTAAVVCTVSVPVVAGLSASPLSFSTTPTTLLPGASTPITITTTTVTPASAPLGYTIGVSCTLGVGSHTANFVLVVAAAFDYSVAWSPSSATVTAGGSTSSNVVATLTSGINTAVACTVLVPAVTGLAATPLSFSITPASPGATQAVAITTTTATPAGVYMISVSCTGGGATHAASPQFSLTVTAPVAVPTVIVNSPTPDPANTGEMVTLTFTVTSSATVTGITVDWGDGTTPDSLAGTATSDHHIYTSTGNLKSQTFTITVTATDSAGPGSGTTMETVNDRSPTASFTFTPPNPSAGQTVSFDASASTDPDGTITSYAWDFGDGTTGTGVTTTHVYNPTSTSSFKVTLTVTDNSGNTGTSSQSVTVMVTTGQPILLTFNGFEIDDCDNSVGQLNVFVNNNLVVNLPPCPQPNGDNTAFTNTFARFGPFDITSFVTHGENTIVFMSPPPGHFGLVSNITIIQGNTVLLHVNGARFVSGSHPVTFTFSNPPLTITTFTANPTPAVDGAPVTFTATFTGGTGPFTCFFTFGDGSPAVIVTTTTGTCSVTHTYDDSGIFSARVKITGQATSDIIRVPLQVNVQSNESDP